MIFISFLLQYHKLQRISNFFIYHKLDFSEFLFKFNLRVFLGIIFGWLGFFISFIKIVFNIISLKFFIFIYDPLKYVFYFIYYSYFFRRKFNMLNFKVGLLLVYIIKQNRFNYLFEFIFFLVNFFFISFQKLLILLLSI